jgi:hypothetical protein
MKTLEFHFLPGDECWVKGQYRVCYIEDVLITTTTEGSPHIMYTWYNLDIGVDVTETWDEGDFCTEDIGKTVFCSLDDYKKACPEDFEFDEYDC